MRHLFKGVVALVATGGMLGLAAPAAFAGDHGDARQSVNVVGDGSSVTIDEASVEAGLISFKVASTNAVPEGSGGSQVTMFQPKKGVPLEQVFADLAEEFSQGDLKAAAKGTRDLTNDVSFFGLADVVPDYPEVVTERLRRGTYYLMDLANPPQEGAPPKLTQLTVTDRRGSDRGSGLDSQVRVRATSHDRFIAPDSWPHEGTYTFRNVSDTLHFMDIEPVKPGTTDPAIQAFFDSPAVNDPAGDPFSLPGPGPGGGNGVVSPGRTIQVSYHLQAGTYVLLCGVADDATGLPHSFMGMHKVITLT